MTDERRMGGEELVGVDAHKDEIASFHAPYRNAIISLIEKPSDAVPLIEMRIREGRRITIIELDCETVGDLARALQGWADKAQNEGS